MTEFEVLIADLEFHRQAIIRLDQTLRAWRFDGHSETAERLSLGYRERKKNFNENAAIPSAINARESFPEAFKLYDERS